MKNEKVLIKKWWFWVIITFISLLFLLFLSEISDLKDEEELELCWGLVEEWVIYGELVEDYFDALDDYCLSDKYNPLCEGRGEFE